jgi:hypothetical protein|tara:strand:+ start:483 stop:908 length:426 start_codon:yes stop_codon:yes gene_type:complete
MRTYYKGILSDYQLYADQRFTYTKLNPKQHFLFKRVLHGLNVYAEEEVRAMSPSKRNRIKKVWRRGQSEVNTLKQKVSNEFTNSIFSIFNNSQLAKNMITDEVDPKYINRFTLKQLGINYDHLIVHFMHAGLLPHNFLQLK